MPPLRILMVCASYRSAVGDTPLVNELAAALADAGHSVQVVVVAWSESPGHPPHAYQEPTGVNVLMLTPRMISGKGTLVARVTKWVATPLSSYLAARTYLKGQTFDLLIGFSPAVALAGPFLWGRRRTRHSLLYITDFFPFHHRSLGSIPGGLVFKVAQYYENALFLSFDVLACMSPAGVTYLRRRYRLRARQRAAVVPLWGPTETPNVSAAADIRA